MSFDIFFQPCNFHGPEVEVKNPFTGKLQSVLQNDSLSPAQLSAVQDVMKRANADGPNEHGQYVVQFDDGGSAELYSTELGEGCMVCVRGTTSDLFKFLFELLKAANWAMLPTMEHAVTVAASSRIRDVIPDGFPEVVVCDSPIALETLLKEGFAAWRQLRDRVMASKQD